MRRHYLALMILTPVLCGTLSCRHGAVKPVPTAQQAAESEAQKTIDRAILQLKANQLREAEATIAPMVGGKILPTQVAQVVEEIKQRQAFAAASVPKSLSDAKAINEVEERFRLPESYGRTVVISRTTPPLEEPMGAMEKLVNRKVSMSLDAAPVKSIIDTLVKIDGLNIIADQALTQDQSGPTLTVQVKDVPLREVLGYIARNMNIAFHLSENVIWVTQADDSAGSGKGPHLETRIYPLRRGLIPGASGGGGGGGAAAGGGAGGGGGGGGDDELETALEKFVEKGPEGAAFQIFRNRNLLVMKNTRENLRQMEQVIKQFDKEPQQVLIEARFVTISEKDLKELGTQISSLKLHDPSPNLDPTFTSKIPSAGGGTASSLSTMNLAGILGNVEYTAVITALDELGLTKNLSAPRLTVLNNQSATIRKGRNLYYWAEWEPPTVSQSVGNNSTALASQADATPSGSPTELQLGMTLDVNVNIGNDGKTILMSLTPAIKSLDGWAKFDTRSNQDPTKDASGVAGTGTTTTGQVYQLPIVADNSVKTTVAVTSGNTVVLGGMLEDTIENTTEQVPLLGNIPVIGWLFKHKKVSSTPQHLLIFVTATVVSTSGEFLDVRETP